MRSSPSRIAAAGLDLMKIQDRRRLEAEKGLPNMPAEEVLQSTREALGLEPLPAVLEKWVKPPPRKGGKPR